MLDRGYRIAALRYELLGAASGHDPRHAFRETRVQIDFVADSETRKNLRLQAEVSVAILPADAKQPLRARWILDRLSFESELDRELHRLGSRVAAELEGVELLGERFEKISQRGSQ